MRPIVTIEGIDEAFDNLNYSNKRTLKYKLINTIREQYMTGSSIDSVTEIDTDFLVKTLWETGDDEAVIRNRRKNFNSIKSSVNAELKKLYDEGKNREGIIINQKNIFDMSEEAKGEILESFSYGGDGNSQIPLDKITDVLSVINDFISNKESGLEDNDKFEQLKEIIKDISGKVGVVIGTRGPMAPGGQSACDIEADGPGIIPYEEADAGGLEFEEDVIDEIEEVPEYEFEELPEHEDDEEVAEEPEEDEYDVLDPEDIPVDEIEEVLDEGEDGDAEVIEDEAVYEIEEIPEEELEELPEDEVIEELEEEPGDDYEEVEIEDAFDDEIEEILDEDSPDAQYDYTLEEILEDYDTTGYLSEEGQQKALTLADEFDKMLSETERYYNRYLLIPGGKYSTGHNAPNGNEKKQQDIRLLEFYFGKFPVTNNLFELFIEKTGYVTTAERTGYGLVYKGRYRNTIDEKSGRKTLEWSSSLESDRVKGACWFKPDGPESSIHGKRYHPVVQVSLEDAMAFAAWTGKRLPTEEEWEAASRTSMGLDYPWGGRIKEGLCNIESSAIGDTTPVDNYERGANKLGVYDLLGNVLEWTGSKDSKSDKMTFTARGGSWVSDENIRLTQRFLLDAKTCSNILGFRCVAYR